MIKKNKLIFNMFIIVIIIFIIITILFLSNKDYKKEYSSRSIHFFSNNEYVVDIANGNPLFTHEIPIEINLLKFNDKNDYEANVYLNKKLIKREKIDKEKNNLEITVDNEGIYSLKISVSENNNIIGENEEKIYVINKYRKQFLDEMSSKGFSSHFGRIDSSNFIELLKASGCKNIRDDFDLWKLYKKENEVDYSWVKKIKDENISIIGIIDFMGKNEKYVGDNYVVDDDKELEKIAELINNKVIENSEINDFELINEPNVKDRYGNDNGIYWYTELSKKIIGNKLILGAVTGTEGENKVSMDSNIFLKNIAKNGGFELCNKISFHKYGNDDNFNSYLSNKMSFSNEIGGFNYLYLTEYGISTDIVSNTDQAMYIIKKSCLSDKGNINKSYVYDFRDTVKPTDNGNKFGVIDYFGNPKESYYSTKYYFTNTNGAEYIGSFTLQDGKTAYVYDKDGKPKIIIWSDNGSKKIDYTDFKASDLYGNEISPDENNQQTVSDSPIYLDNVSKNYFYQAISNTIINGYSEFNAKFADEISKVDGLTEKINNLNTQAVSLKNVDTFNENKANELMKEHFELGNMIMSAYENGNLNVEYVKLSSMLDVLNTIGNSYEDLVTASAKTRITDLSDITNEVNTAKSLAQDNEKFDIVYPNKIYKFAQDFLDTSSYVLGLEEENDIKTGLINSKALHAKYLAEWSQEFSKIYMKDALKDSINKIISTNREIKQNYSNILLNNEVSSCYNGISDLLKEISENVEKCDLDKVDSLYNKELDFAKLIASKYYSKELNIKESDFKSLEKKLVDTLNSYEGLYKCYVSEDSISQDDVADTLNNIVNLYNDNIDIDLSTETEMIKGLKNTYEGLNSVEDSEVKYFEKLNIEKSCELIKIILDGDIKNKANSEYKAISIMSNTDLSNLTNKDVSISLKLPDDKVKITNNNGSGNVTFSQNGEFTFEMEIRGYTYTYKITVNNIDKTSPKLNVTSTGTSIESTATDENLKELKVEKDGKVIPYNHGEEITTPGIYKITAIDKANNQTTSKEIIYGIFKNTSNQDIKYVPINANKLKAKTLKENADFTIKNGIQELEDDANVATGNKLVKDGQEYTLIVKGDITKNGQVGTLDLIALRKNIVGLTKLENEQALAADINNDGKVNVIDLINERKKMVGL